MHQTGHPLIFREMAMAMPRVVLVFPLKGRCSVRIRHYLKRVTKSVTKIIMTKPHYKMSVQIVTNN